MPTYLVADTTITDPKRFESYRVLVQAALTKYGGRYLVRGHTPQVLEGDWQPDKMAIIEFSSTDQARQFYDSPEYRTARDARTSAANVNMVMVQGT